MPERLSRILAAVEALIIALPATLAMIFLLLFAGTIGYAMQYPMRDVAMLIALTVVTTSLAAGWWLLVVFIRSGWQQLQQQRLWLWLVFGAGIAVVLIGWLMAMSTPVVANTDSLGIMLFGGTPIVTIPFFHLLAERLARTNNSLERTQRDNEPARQDIE